MINGAEAIVKSLERERVRLLFGMPGAETLGLFNALRESNIKSILVTHEQSAAFMADSYYKVTGEVGVCCSIGGPGITNMFTGLAEAYLDSSAVVALISSTRSDDNKFFHLHQINQSKAVRPLVKDVLKVEKSTDLPILISEAFYLARTGEPGPVVIEVSVNIINKKNNFTDYYEKKAQDIYINDYDEKIKEITNLLVTCRRLCIFAGSGAINASAEIIELAEKLSVPVATTISGRGVIPENHQLALGCGFGFGNSRLVYNIISNSDTVLAVGCKFSELSTGKWSLKMPKNLIHIDRNKDVLNKNYPARITLVSDVKIFLKDILSVIKNGINIEEKLKLLEEIKQEKEGQFRDIYKYKSKEGVCAEKLFYELRKLLDRDSILVTDCGNHQFYAISYFTIFKERTFITPTDFHAMGFCIPAAIAAKVAYPQKKVVCVCGDGGFLMSGFELLTAVREKLDLTVIIFNDSALGLIKELQKALYGRVNCVDFINPNYKNLADALGAGYIEINNEQQVIESLRNAFLLKGVVIVNCKIDYRELPSHIKNINWETFKRVPLKQKLYLISKIAYNHHFVACQDKLFVI